MSLSFVSKSVQTARDDGGYDEKPIENGNEIHGTMTTSSYQKPLFEQLRDKQLKEDNEREEEKIHLMRSTLTLDEDDAEHLQQVYEQQKQNYYNKQQQTINEINEFHLAQIQIKQQQQQQQQQQLFVDENGDDDNDNDNDNNINNDKSTHTINNENDVNVTSIINNNEKSNMTIKKQTKRLETLIPKLVVKKRRKIDITSSNDTSNCSINTTTTPITNPEIRNASDASINNDTEKAIVPPTSTNSSVAISNLLCGYGSSSSSSSDDEND